jgi:hypothetical protein
MYARQHERQAMKDALEMAVLTTVSHPNIIQVYNCFTDMVEDAGASQSELLLSRDSQSAHTSKAGCNICWLQWQMG